MKTDRSNSSAARRRSGRHGAKRRGSTVRVEINHYHIVVLVRVIDSLGRDGSLGTASTLQT